MSWAFRAAGTAASSTIGGNVSPGLPAGTAEGDLLVCVVACLEGSASISVSGWSTIDSGTTASGAGGTVCQAVFYKVAGAGESVPTVSYGGLLGIIAQIAGWSGVASISPIDVAGANTVNNNNNAVVTFAAVTTNYANDLVVCLGVSEGSGGAVLLTISGSPTPDERFDSVIGVTGPHVFLADFNLASAGSSTARSASLSVGGARIGRQVAFREFVTTAKSLTVTEVAAASLSRPATFPRTLALATAVGVSGITRAIVRARSILASAVGVASSTRSLTRSVSVAAISTGVAALARGSTFARLLVAAAPGTASLARRLELRISLSAAAVGSAALSRARTVVRSLSTTSGSSASLVQNFIAATQAIRFSIRVRMASLVRKARIRVAKP